jgi:hypothetical protein
MKSENVNFLEPSGPLQKCYVTALPLPLLLLLFIQLFNIGSGLVSFSRVRATDQTLLIPVHYSFKLFVTV